MRVVFMGTPEFAVPSLERLAQEHDLAAVYVRPDAVSGRGAASRPAAVKLTAEALGLEVRQPATLRDPEVVHELTALGADIVCVAAYGLILPATVLEAAALGAVNVHGSLLPRWRGAAPIQRAILAGDAMVGVSIMKMEEGLDTGPFCVQRGVATNAKNAGTLTIELAELGALLLAEALPTIADGTVVWTPQPDAGITYAAKVTKGEVAPDPALSAAENVLRIRASSPGAPARILAGGKGLTLVDAVLGEGIRPMAPAELCDADRDIALGTASGVVFVRRVKPDGKTEMDAAAWLRGARLGPDAVWASAR